MYIKQSLVVENHHRRIIQAKTGSKATKSKAFVEGSKVSQRKMEISWRWTGENLTRWGCTGFIYIYRYMCVCGAKDIVVSKQNFQNVLSGCSEF